MNKGFFFRRLSPLFPCVLKSGDTAYISLNNKHNIASFQDVYMNGFYWEALLKLDFAPTIIYDLGANYGLFSSLCEQVLNYKAGNYKKQYFLIEANEELAKYLNKNIYHLINQEEVSVLYGLAGPIKDLYFKSNTSNLLASKIEDKGKRVPFINFNTLPNPELLKVDIEGAETLLLENYLDWLSHAKALIIEFHQESAERLIYENKLAQSGFKLIISKAENSGFTNQLWLKQKS